MTKFGLSVVIIAMTTTIVPTEGITPSIGTVEVEAASVSYYTIDNLNLRSGASTNFKVMVTIPKGKQVSYVSKSGSWSKVKYGSKSGYVSSKYLKSTEVATKPVKIPVTKIVATYPAPSTKTPGKYVDGILIVNKKNGLPSSYNPGVNSIAQLGVNAMKADAKKQGISLNAFSTYRTYSYQAKLYTNYTKKYGETRANRFSARPGYSEHQSGLAFDFGGTNRSHWLEESFALTKEGEWLYANAHKYGFILRYQKGKESITGYMFEPWHYRYVGSDVSTKVKASGKTLEEYFEIAGE